MSLRVIAKIIGYHGLKGEIKLYPLIDDLSYFDNFEFLEISNKTYHIDSYRIHKNTVLLKLAGIDTRDQAENLSGLVKAELNEALSDSEIYIDDLMGAKVYDKESKEIGHVSSFSDQGQSLIGVKFNSNLYKGKEVLVPFVEKYILEISSDKKSIKVDITEDLIDLAV